MPSAGSMWMKAYAYAAIAFFSGALHRPLSGSPSSYVGVVESPTVQIVGSLIILIAGIFTGRALLFRPNTQPLYPTTIGFILGLLCIWILMSIGWSADPDVSFRRGVAFVGTVLVSWVLATHLPRDEMIRVLGRAAIGFIAVSGVLAVTKYGYAFHETGIVGNPEHAGRMRGSFAHKNDFARIVALAMLFTIVAGQSAFGRRWPAVLALTAGAAMLVLAGSVKVMIALPVAIFGAMMMLFCNTPPQRLALLIFVGIPMALLLWSGQFDVWIEELFSAFGRDADMSGRDVIWAEAKHSIADHWLAGQGYAAGWDARERIHSFVAQGRTNIAGNAHNGYLETLLDIGLVGLVLSLAPLAYILWDTLFPGPHRGRLLDYLSASFAVFFIMVNIVGSYLSAYNDIFTVSLVCLALWISQGRRRHRLLQQRRRLALIAERHGRYPADAPAPPGWAGSGSR
jgi:O-antigen ligase